MNIEKKNSLKINYNDLDSLSKKYGDSFYILDLDMVRKNYISFNEAFKKNYYNTTVAFSYKTNYIPYLCKYLDKLGAFSEVVSSMEYELAKKIGVEPTRIIFNGPVKSFDAIEEALLNGTIVNIDSLYEIEHLKKLGKKYPSKRFKVGIRVNFDIGEYRISRFGLDTKNGEFEEAVNKIEKISNIVVDGLHCHFSTKKRSIDSFRLRTKKMLELSETFFKSKFLRYIDLGGGFFGNMDEELRNQFDADIPSYQEYSAVIAGQFKDFYKSEPRPELIVEPGIAIIGNAMKYVTKIICTKNIKGKKFAITSGSALNIKPSLHSKNLPVKVFSNNKSQGLKILNNIEIVGSTCVENDNLYSGYSGTIKEGDYIVFDQVGGYTIVMNPPFINPMPSIIAYSSERDEFFLVKNPGDFNSIFSSYIF